MRITVGFEWDIIYGKAKEKHQIQKTSFKLLCDKKQMEEKNDIITDNLSVMFWIFFEISDRAILSFLWPTTKSRPTE